MLNLAIVCSKGFGTDGISSFIMNVYRHIDHHLIRCCLIYPKVIGNEAIAVLKETSIVGLIAVVDLTRASDLVRSRTMQPYFPLLAVALIYFLLVYGLSTGVSKLEKRLARSDRG